MRIASRVDANQSEIVKALRGIGASVLMLHQIKNAFDLLIGYRGINIIIEVKDGAKPASAQKLTSGEELFKASWRGGNYNIATSVQEAIDIVTKSK